MQARVIETALMVPVHDEPLPAAARRMGGRGGSRGRVGRAGHDAQPRAEAAKVPHRLSNEGSEDFLFVLVSTPPSHGDRVVVEEAP